MSERDEITLQILALQKSRGSVFREGPYLEAGGDWRSNLKGIAAG